MNRTLLGGNAGFHVYVFSPPQCHHLQIDLIHRKPHTTLPLGSYFGFVYWGLL